MSYEQRNIYILKLPLQQDDIVLRPELTVINFYHRMSVDIGAICYLIREPVTKNNHRSIKKGRAVQIDSLDKQRVSDVRKLIKFISDKILLNSNRIETVRDMVSRVVSFINWADQNGHYNFLNNHTIAKEAVVQYTEFLNTRVLKNQIKYNSAARQQSTVINFFKEFFEYGNFTIGIRVMRVDYTLKNNTLPPCESKVSKVLSLCESLFDGLCSLVLDKETYPYKLKVPNHLKFPDNILWIFPAESWFINPLRSLDKRNSCLGFNYKDGKINTLEQIANLRFKPSKIVNDKLILKNANRSLIEANLDFRHTQRMHVAMIALNAFIILFLSRTAMNWAGFVSLTWSDDYEITSHNQLFRIVKWRASGKSCEFELPIEFMPRFKRFLQLRKYLLNDKKTEFLFFTMGERGLGTPAQIKSPSLQNIYTSFKRISPDLDIIHSKEFRAFKSDWLIRNTDLSTTAKVLQNTEKTVLQSYIAGSASTHWQEMSNFLNHISNMIISDTQKHENWVQAATGKCVSYNNPAKLYMSQEANKPNCMEPQNCVFCDKFKLHVDTQDIRKLLSCRYYINKIIHLTGDINYQKKAIHPILERIDIILEKLKTYNGELFEKISRQVEEGELDIYWARKLEMFLELNWIV
ncbi:conserved hypothetical protein [Moraxella osloensis]|nr:conserved hypothetical protein [Moraxella osloensis]